MPPRKYDVLRVGDRRGNRVIIAVLPRGFHGRSDERVAWACDCGRTGETFAFNFRLYPKACLHAGRPRKEERS